MTEVADIKSVLEQVAAHYPQGLRSAERADIERIAFHIGLVFEANSSASTLCDLGGGIGLFSVGCAALGLRATLVDDFADDINQRYGADALDAHRRYGVRVVAKNVIEDTLQFDDGEFDVITSFDSMEHWHNSPKRLLHQALRWLRPGGLFILGVPNCVNLRKRISVPFGVGKWSSMEEWYGLDVFRGHVREPDVDDLRYIARDLGLVDPKILGRNWLGYASRRQMVRNVMPYVDRVLRMRPSLCSDIYLIGRSRCD